jgi:hypothetical protein
MRTLISKATLFALLPLAVARSASATEEYISLNIDGSGKQDFYFRDHPDPKAILIMFEGGPGRFGGIKSERTGQVDPWGFLDSSRDFFPRKGFAVAAVQPPSYKYGDLRGSDNARTSARFRQNVEQVIAWVRTKYDRPVWLLGVSLGTQAAAAIAASTEHKIDGLVLISSKTQGTGASVLSLGLQNIKVPTLVLAHKREACPETPLRDADNIIRALTNSPRAEAQVLDGGYNVGRRPCEPLTYHTFNGMELKVVNVIADFIEGKKE